MSYIEDVPQLMSERYNLMLRRERWRGAGTGATLCNTATVLVNLGAIAFGLSPMSGWLYFCCPAVSVFALWRHHLACKRIDAIDGGFRDAVKLAPQPKPKEGMVN